MLLQQLVWLTGSMFMPLSGCAGHAGGRLELDSWLSCDGALLWFFQCDQALSVSGQALNNE